MNEGCIHTMMDELFVIDTEVARVLLGTRLPTDERGPWTAENVAASTRRRMASHDRWHPPFLAKMQGLADNPPANIAEIGGFVLGLRAANAGEILADAPDYALHNLLAAIDPSKLSWLTLRLLMCNCLYDGRGDAGIPRSLLAIFEEIEANGRPT
jgi:hypothetical protein